MAEACSEYDVIAGLCYKFPDKTAREIIALVNEGQGVKGFRILDTYYFWDSKEMYNPGFGKWTVDSWWCD